jgi:GH24 family phage-related lysozyme (muramidase)
MARKNTKLIEEAKQIIEKSESSDICYVGNKPWYSRALSKFKFGLVTGLATGLISGMSAFGVVDLNSTSKLLEESIQEIKVLNNFGEKVGVSSLTVDVPNNIASKKLKVSSEQVDSLRSFREKYANVDFSGLKSQRDVSKQFVGKNNFIALAAEMEGFRGDLHKDPATGLNIGFGYNITKRVQASKEDVEKDLLSIGIDGKRVARIIDVSQQPQGKLTKEIKKFHNDFKINNPEIITMEQGVALLGRTQKQYQEEASSVFSKTFHKMGQNQKEVLTYAAYKAGAEALSKYKKAIIAAENIYAGDKQPSKQEMKKIAKELTFFYMKDGKEMVLDERAELIGHTFIDHDYLKVQIGDYKGLKSSSQKLAQNRINFSIPKAKLDKKPVGNTFEKGDLNELLEKMREKKSGKHLSLG